MTPVKEDVLITAGASVTYITHIAAYAILVTPILHALALFGSFAVAVVTVWWTVQKIRDRAKG